MPFTLGGVHARVNGVDAALAYVSPTQINLQVPYETGSGPAAVGIVNGSQVGGILLNINATSPAIFTDVNGFVAGALPVKAGDVGVLYFTGDGDLTVTYADGAAPAVTTALSNLGKSRQPFSITVGGQTAFVTFYGRGPGQAAVSQVNYIVPAGTAAGVQNVIVQVGSAQSPSAKITVQ
jgi:uncharacterized protein (TIGR03437 family)